MEQFLSLEALSIVAVASGALGWVLGETFSHLRNSAYFDELEVLEEDSALFTLKVPPKIISRHELDDLSDEVGIEFPGAIAEDAPARRPIDGPVVANQPLDPIDKGEEERVSLRREVFADMPPLAELRREAEYIRRSEKLSTDEHSAQSLAEFVRTADAATISLLEQYRDSISELHDLNEAMNGDLVSRGAFLAGAEAAESEMQVTLDAIPSLRDVAPLDPRIPASQLTRRHHGREGSEVFAKPITGTR